MAGINTPIPKLRLNDANQMPMLAFGTGTALQKRTPTSTLDRVTVDAIKTAIKLGYYHLDTAEMYHTELEMGAAIKESKIERSKLFVTTKVSKSYANIAAAVDASLKNLGLDYLDL